MRSIILPLNFTEAPKSLNRLAQDSGLAWKTANAVLQGQGTITSLDRLRRALKLRWSWTSVESQMGAGVALAERRKTKRLSQRDMAAKLNVSPQTIISLETKFRGRIDTLMRYLRILRVAEVLASPSRRLVPGQNAPEADIVYTPQELAARIVEKFAPDMNGIVLDPARGNGAFYDVFPNHVERRWCEVTEGRDFYDWSEPVDWIVTNPPWSELKEFLRHSMRVAQHVVFLSSLSHYTTKHRISMIDEAGFGLRKMLFVPTPSEWPSSGFQMAAVHLQQGWKGPCDIGRLN